MFRNYLQIFLNNLKRKPIFAFLSIFGLSLGIAVSYIVALYTLHELSYDKIHKDADQIYRVGLQGVLSGNEFLNVTSCAPMSKALANEVPGVRASTRIGQWSTLLIQQGDIPIVENNVVMADPNFFEFWSFKLLAGDPETLLSEKHKIVFTETTAKKYFPDEPYANIIGKTLQVGNDKTSYEITGVMEDPPTTVHFEIPLLISMDTWDYSHDLQWTNNSLFTYFKADPAADIKAITAGINSLVAKYVGPEIQQFLGITLAEFQEGGGSYGYFVQPLLDIHLQSSYEGELDQNGDLQNVIIFGLVGLFVLVIAGINFVNLSTARASDRAKEVGIRKSIGAHRNQLMTQYLFEAFCYCLIAGLIGLLLLAVSIAPINQILDRAFTLSQLFAPGYLLFYLGFIALLSILSGIYPSLIMSAYQPADILKGTTQTDKRSFFTARNTMVVLQFALTTIAIVLTVTIYKQLDLMRTKKLGFNKEQVLVVYNARGLSNQKTFKNELLKMSGIKTVSLTNGYPPRINSNSVTRIKDTQEDHLFWQYSTDPQHLETFGLELIEGRFFEDATLDENSVIINRAAMKLIGWENIEGKQVEDFEEDGNNSYSNVVGVVEDFHFQNFKSAIQPVMIYCTEEGRFITIKLNNTDPAVALEQIESIWNEFTGNKPFDYSFVDQQFEQLFDTEQRLAQLTSILTILTIVTALLGLFGLAAYIARSRRKEFSIRKVLGASLIGVFGLQLRYFLTIAIIGLSIALPLSYYFVNLWLADFQYSIPNNWTIYVVAVISVILLILVTVSYQSYTAATTSITKVLREE